MQKQTKSIEFLLTVGQDVRYTLRTLRKNAVFAATAVLTFALGIGATTAIFTVVNGVLLRPLAYRDPDRIVHVATGTVARYEEMKPAAQSFVELGAYADRPGSVTLSGEGEPEVLRLASVSANFLHILGVEPILGRSFLPEEETLGGAPVWMLSADLWRRRFAADPSIAGKTATLSGRPATIIGVLPEGFQFPFPGIDIWVTQPTLGLAPTTPGLSIIGRLKPGIDVEQASAELGVLTRQYAVAHPGMLDARPNAVPRVTLLKDRLVGNVRSLLWMLFGVVGLVLLIACANVATLLLARSHSRSREFAVRAAIGAGRRRIIRQLLVESILLASTGGAVGVLLGHWSLRVMTQMSAFNLPRLPDIRLDATVLAFAIAVSLATGVLFGLLPSLGLSTPDLTVALKSGANAPGYRGSRTRTLLVMAQVALSVILLIGASLLIQSMVRLYRVDVRFNAENVLTMQVALSPIRYNTDQRRVAFADDLVRRVEALPGVRGTGIAWTLPFMGWPGTPVQAADRPAAPLNERLIAVINMVNAGYFRTLQIPLRRGRLFTEEDDPAMSPVGLINETLARRLWPEYPNGQDPIGRRLLVGASTTPVEIVGVVADIVLNPSVDIQPAVYRPYRQAPAPAVAFAVRTDGDPMRFAAGVREQLRQIDREQGIIATRTMDGLLEEALGQRRFVLTLLELFAGVALILAVIGVHGVIANSVTQRTREVAVRIALGARPRNVLRALVVEGFGITIAGVAIGIGGALGLTRFLKSYLFQVSPTEAMTFIAVAVVFVLAASAATYLPLRRATRIDPMTVLRHE